jgi:hypothetical protein
MIPHARKQPETALPSPFHPNRHPRSTAPSPIPGQVTQPVRYAMLHIQNRGRDDQCQRDKKENLNSDP